MIKDILNKVNEKALMDSIYNSIIVTSNKLEGPDHPKILYVNEGFERVTGYKAEEVIGKTPRILQGEKTDRAVIDRLVSTLEKGEFFEGTTINYKKDGSEYHVEWNITPILDNKGDLDCYFCVQKDTTESMKYRNHLEKRVKEEVEKVKTKDELIQMQSKQAAMGEMVDAIAHQWLKPLNGISLKAQFIPEFYEGEKSVPYKEVLNNSNSIVEYVNHLTETLDEFRDFLRPNKPQEQFNILDCLKSVQILLKDELISSKISLDLDIDKNLNVNGIENEFKHVIINLISNAKDAFEELELNDRRIELSSMHDENGSHLIVKDNAGGIPSNIIENIFKPNVTSKEEGKGTGIGLYLSKQILDKIGATIRVSNVYEGACFKISF